MKSEGLKQAEMVMNDYNEVSSRQAEMLALLKTAKKKLPDTDELIIITVDYDGVAHIGKNVSNRHLIAILELLKHRMIHKLFGREL